MRTRRLVSAALLAALAGPPAARAGDATGVFAPYEDVLEVVADLTWHLGDDVYRFPAPKDPTGHDLYRLTLRRLENWETRFPRRLRDVTTFARAEALERLGAYRGAADAFARVAALESPLAARAREGAARAGAFAEADALPEHGADLEATLAVLRRKLDAWADLGERHAGTRHEALVRVEEERLEVTAADLVVRHRREIEDGDATAERALRFLVSKHAASKNLPDHVLRLAELYAALAREFAERADRALDTYRKVATWDGVPEKLEAQARFTAFEAYKTNVLARYR
jgi:hypothetical protein